MCGICGIINFDQTNKINETQLRGMMKSIKHRGPDDEGHYIDNNIGLGFVRLSIIDLSPAGHQPMISEDGRYVLIFNGEIYNYIELREELSGKYVFRTKTDTEVLLNAYREWGRECLHKFNGMFAFVIYDTKTRDLFFARDRFGIKPFYYSIDNERLIFASEARAIIPFLKDPAPNSKALYEYLVFNRTDQGDFTFFRDINKLHHGSCAVYKDGKFQAGKWYELEQHIKAPFADPGEFYQGLRESVKLRLRSDVPIGVCLSGGLDSSSIVSIMMKEFDKHDVNTFSAVYEKGEQADESSFIDLYKGQLENMHYTRPTAATLRTDLEDLVDCHSEPVATMGPYAQFSVMKLAKQHVTVTLDGQGADEQLAGYHYFYASLFKEQLRQFKLGTLFKEMNAYRKMQKSIYALKYLGLYMMPPFLKDRMTRMSHDYIDDGFYTSGKDQSQMHTTLYNPKNLNQSLIQHFEYKLEHLLKWEDHNSMWHSIESRVPFLDHRFVERTLSLPSDKLIKNGYTKAIMREAMKGVLPEPIRMRTDKIGFLTPWEKWLTDDTFKTYIMDTINSAAFSQRGYLNAALCRKGYENFLSGKKIIPKEVWKWLNIDIWFRTFIEKS